MIARIAPYLLAATLALSGLSFFSLQGWWNANQARLETERSLELAQAAIDKANEGARRLHAENATAAAELANAKSALAKIPSGSCFRQPMPGAAIRLLDEARSRAAARALGSAD